MVVIGGPLLAVSIASAAASSALVVPDDAQVQTVRVSAGTIMVDPTVLQPGPTRFRCEFAGDAAPEWASLVALPEGTDVETAPSRFDDYYSSCGLEPGSVSWGTTADLEPGRYVWRQIDYLIDYQTDPRTVTTSSVIIVAP